MAVYNVPEKISMLQQNHLQDLNVSEGGYKLTLAAAFEQCILSCISSYRNEASVWADKIPPFAVCCVPASQRVSTTAAAIYAVSKGTLPSN